MGFNGEEEAAEADEEEEEVETSPVEGDGLCIMAAGCVELDHTTMLSRNSRCCNARGWHRRRHQLHCVSLAS